MLHAVLDKTTRHLVEMWLLVSPKYKELWGKSYSKELGRLAQGMSKVSKGTNTIVFICRKDIPHNCKWDVTYARVCVNYRPEKEDPNRTRVTVGGNLLHYPGDCGTLTVDMITIKLHLNSIISTKNACYCTIDLKDFYLSTPMDRPEYMRMKISNLPPNFVKAYNVIDLATNNGTIYIKIQKGVYDLPQAGILAQNLLGKRLNQHNYHQSKVTPGLWKHDWWPLLFTLCVNDFGIKYVGQEHTNHLAKILEKHYKCSIDWNGNQYFCMTMDWDYNGHKVHVSMLHYVPEALTCFQHQAPNKPLHQPYPHIKPNYRVKAQYTEDTDTSALLPNKDKNFIQEVTGTFLYYAQCVDSTMLAALGSIATQQANPTENTMKKVRQSLDYASTHPDAIVAYHTSDMVLAGHSIASYLSKSKTCSQAGGHFFVSINTAKTPNNGAILTIAQIIKAVMSLAAEAEVGALYINCREAIPACHTLEFIGHPQPLTRIHWPSPTSNPNADGQHHCTWRCQQQCYQEIESYGHEVPLAPQQRMLRTILTPLGPRQREQRDYVTKHHATIHHQATCPTFLTSISTLQALCQQLSQQLTGKLPVARVC
jgi:hypothetical protein